MRYRPHNYQQYAADFILEHPVCCLMLDMGLGKTVQVLAYLEHLRKTKPDAAVLLVVPASLLRNWEKEKAGRS